MANSPISTGLEQARFNMIEQQVRTWEVLSPDVLEVLRTVPREDFVPGRYRKLAFSDLRIPLGHEQVMMKPLEEGRLLQALALEPDHEVLEIGTGSGFLAACLGRLAGRVTSLEILEGLAEPARKKLVEAGSGNVSVEVGDVMTGWAPAHAVDSMIVTGSIAVPPAGWGEWIRTGGYLLCIRGHSPAMEAVLMRNLGGGQWLEDSLFETDMPRLIGAEDAETFEF